MSENPFTLATRENKKIKCLVWGASGSGKTTLALSFPAPVVIDMEGGCDLYGDNKKFSVLRTSSLPKIRDAVKWLATEKHEFQTLVIDPISVYWEETQRYWQSVFLQRLPGKSNKTEFFDLGPKEWAKIKDSYKCFVQRLLDLDLNILLVARSKPRYKDGGFMVADGEAPDCEKSTEYLFDVVLRLYVEGGKYLAATIKDRSGRLPATVETNQIVGKLFESEKK